MNHSFFLCWRVSSLVTSLFPRVNSTTHLKGWNSLCTTPAEIKGTLPKPALIFTYIQGWLAFPQVLIEMWSKGNPGERFCKQGSSVFMEIAATHREISSPHTTPAAFVWCWVSEKNNLFSSVSEFFIGKERFLLMWLFIGLVSWLKLFVWLVGVFGGFFGTFKTSLGAFTTHTWLLAVKKFSFESGGKSKLKILKAWCNVEIDTS